MPMTEEPAPTSGSSAFRCIRPRSSSGRSTPAADSGITCSASNASFTEVVNYYKNVLKQKGELVYDEPPVHEFDVGEVPRKRRWRFRQA